MAHKISTRKQALAAGYAITRGSYVGTTADRIDRWYLESVDAHAVDRCGNGYATVKEALQEVARIIAEDDDTTDGWPDAYEMTRQHRMYHY